MPDDLPKLLQSWRAAPGDGQARETAMVELLAAVKRECGSLRRDPSLQQEVESQAIEKLRNHLERGGDIHYVAYVSRTVANCLTDAYRRRATVGKLHAPLDVDEEEGGHPVVVYDDAPDLRLAALREAFALVDDDSRAILLAATEYGGVQAIADRDLADEVARGVPGAGAPGHARRLRERWDKRSQRARLALRRSAEAVVVGWMLEAVDGVLDELGLAAGGVRAEHVPLRLGRVPPVAVSVVTDLVLALLVERDGVDAASRRPEVQALLQRGFDDACAMIAHPGGP